MQMFFILMKTFGEDGRIKQIPLCKALHIHTQRCKSIPYFNILYPHDNAKIFNIIHYWYAFYTSNGEDPPSRHSSLL